MEYSFLQLVTIIIGVDVGLASVAAIFAGAWVKATRLDKMQSHIDELYAKTSAIAVLESRITGIESGIREIKDLLKK